MVVHIAHKYLILNKIYFVFGLGPARQIHPLLSLALNALFYPVGQNCFCQTHSTEARWHNRMGTKMAYELKQGNLANESGEELLQLGLQYCLGQGVRQNRVEAHKWFSISALKGCEAAKAYRIELAQEMSVQEIAASLRMARELITLH